MHRHQILWTVITLGVLAFSTSWRAPRAAWLVLTGIVALILYVTLRSGPGVAAADCFLPADTDARVLDVAQNVILFLPVGLSIAALRPRRPLRIATIVGLLLSIGVEVAQRFEPSRCPSPIDVVTNATGAFVGAAVIVFAHAVVQRFQRNRSARS